MGYEGRGRSRKAWQCGCRRTAQPHNLFRDACALCSRSHWRLMLASAGDSASWRERHQRLAVPGTLLSLWYESGCVRLFDCLCVRTGEKTGSPAHALVEIRPHLPHYSCDTAGNVGQHKVKYTPNKPLLDGVFYIVIQCNNWPLPHLTPVVYMYITHTHTHTHTRHVLQDIKVWPSGPWPGSSQYRSNCETRAWKVPSSPCNASKDCGSFDCGDGTYSAGAEAICYECYDGDGLCSAGASESFACLSTVGWIFTVALTYSGFLVFFFASFWNANLIGKLIVIRNKWHALRRGERASVGKDTDEDAADAADAA